MNNTAKMSIRIFSRVNFTNSLFKNSYSTVCNTKSFQKFSNKKFNSWSINYNFQRFCSSQSHNHNHNPNNPRLHPLHPDPIDHKIHSPVSPPEIPSNLDFLDDDSADDRLAHLFANNRVWADSVERSYPGFFNRLAAQQTPKYLWIGCSDSRVPASEITGLMPGEVFVHRNVANCVLHSDFNVQSVIQIAVDIIKVEHIIVCGHYQCAGISLGLDNKQIGLADHWIRHIKDVAVKYNPLLNECPTIDEKKKLLTELNVKKSVENVCISSTVQNAWAKGQKIIVHGWVYSVHNGLLKDLITPPISSIKQVNQLFHFNAPQ